MGVGCQWIGRTAHRGSTHLAVHDEPGDVWGPAADERARRRRVAGLTCWCNRLPVTVQHCHTHERRPIRFRLLICTDASPGGVPYVWMGKQNQETHPHSRLILPVLCLACLAEELGQVRAVVQGLRKRRHLLVG